MKEQTIDTGVMKCDYEIHIKDNTDGKQGLHYGHVGPHGEVQFVSDQKSEIQFLDGTWPFSEPPPEPGNIIRLEKHVSVNMHVRKDAVPQVQSNGIENFRFRSSEHGDRTLVIVAALQGGSQYVVKFEFANEHIYQTLKFSPESSFAKTPDNLAVRNQSTSKAMITTSDSLTPVTLEPGPLSFFPLSIKHPSLFEDNSQLLYFGGLQESGGTDYVQILIVDPSAAEDKKEAGLTTSSADSLSLGSR